MRKNSDAEKPITEVGNIIPLHIPSVLDEAAEKYSENFLANNEDLQDAIEDAFKAGAEWMAGRGVNIRGRVSPREQPEVDLEKVVEFECIGKKVKTTVQELINYYIDRECADVADECGF